MSLRFRTGKLDHFGPLFGLRINELAEITYRQRHRLAPKISEAAFELRIGKRRVDLFVQLLDDRGRRSLGRSNSEPCGSLVAR